jgi:hypothetical protein
MFLIKENSPLLKVLFGSVLVCFAMRTFSFVDSQCYRVLLLLFLEGASLLQNYKQKPGSQWHLL